MGWNGADTLFRVEICNGTLFSGTISKVLMEQPNPNRVAKTEMEHRCNGPFSANSDRP
jgi:hypothetical protein